MLVIEVLERATVERAGMLVAREHAAARQARPELPAAFDIPDVCTAALQRLCDSGHHGVVVMNDGRAAAVMAAEALEHLAIRPDGIYIDATAGLGGHTGQIAARLSTGLVIANDRDESSLAMARQNTRERSERIRYHHGTFAQLAHAMADAGV